MNATVRCPAVACRAVFEVDPGQLGRATRCPACSVRMTARPLAVERRLAEQERRIEGSASAAVPRLPFVVLLESVRSLWNVGSIFRTADACGVRTLFLTGITGFPPREQISKTALGAERAVAWRYRADAANTLRQIRADGFVPVALETSPRSVPFDEMRWPDEVCLVVGNEVAGVSSELLQGCEQHVHIPMLGVKSSLNVAVAFGIAAHHVARRLRSAAAAGRAS